MTDKTEFDLAINTNLIIGTQVDVVVTYHLSESDAIININELPNNYTNIANPQTIYARLTDFNTECFNVSEFQLDINFGPDYTAPTDFIICDDNADGDLTNGRAIFDLSIKNTEITDGQNPLDFNISYYRSLAEAENSLNSLPELYYNTTPFLEELVVRIESAANPNCQSFSTLTLIVNEFPEIHQYFTH